MLPNATISSFHTTTQPPQMHLQIVIYTGNQNQNLSLLLHHACVASSCLLGPSMTGSFRYLGAVFSAGHLHSPCDTQLLTPTYQLSHLEEQLIQHPILQQLVKLFTLLTIFFFKFSFIFLFLILEDSLQLHLLQHQMFQPPQPAPLTLIQFACCVYVLLCYMA